MSAPADGAASPAGRLATAVATVSGIVVLVLATIVLGALVTLVGWLPPRGWLVAHIGRWWARAILAAGGVRLRVHGGEGLDPRRGVIYMANHQSMFDVLALLASLPGRVCFMAKRSLFRIPIFGWALHTSGFIPVDRGSRAGAKATFQTALERLESGRSILLFPEETRSHDGRLLPFKPGGFLMALKTGQAILPVGIRGTRAVQPKSSYLIRPGTVEVHYGRPIDTGRFGVRQRQVLTAEVRAAVAALAGDG